MSATYRTCTYISDAGICKSAAVKKRNYCAFHLRHRARLMRMAQARARQERVVLALPPLENMLAVQSALNQLMEAAAGDMIDLKRGRFLLSVIRAAGQFLLRADKWQANPYHREQPDAEIDLAAEYGLPDDLDLDSPPEIAFPQPADPRASQTDNRQLTTHNSPPPLPYSGHYCGEHHSRECDCVRIGVDHPLTPEMVECLEVTRTCGPDVAAARSKQLERNSERRRLNRERKRFAAIALEHNMRHAAERIAELKLAEHARQDKLAARKPPDSVPADPRTEAQIAEKPVLTPTR